MIVTKCATYIISSVAKVTFDQVKQPHINRHSFWFKFLISSSLAFVTTAHLANSIATLR